jgi:hypothetical protein
MITQAIRRCSAWVTARPRSHASQASAKSSSVISADPEGSEVIAQRSPSRWSSRQRFPPLVEQAGAQRFVGLAVLDPPTASASYSRSEMGLRTRIVELDPLAQRGTYETHAEHRRNQQLVAEKDRTLKIGMYIKGELLLLLEHAGLRDVVVEGDHNTRPPAWRFVRADSRRSDRVQTTQPSERCSMLERLARDGAAGTGDGASSVPFPQEVPRARADRRRRDHHPP